MTSAGSSAEPRGEPTAEGPAEGPAEPPEELPAEGQAEPPDEIAQDEKTVGEGLAAAGAWLELSVVADHEAIEAVSEILSRFAPGGTTVEPAFQLADEGLTAQVDPTRPATVRAYLPARDRRAARRATAAAREALGHLQAFGLRPIGDLEVRLVLEEDWAHAWKDHFPVLRIGRRLVIRPPWRRHRRRPGDVVLALDPGMAFGTGLHPTTRLCLAGIERWADQGRFDQGRFDGGRFDGPATATRPRLLDVGCGSGILAIAAGLFGAGEIVGLDTDPIAIEATTENARRNRLAGRLRARQGSLPSGDGRFDLVVANLIASLLVVLSEPLAAELRPGGRLLASGIFVDREPDVRRAFESAGLTVVDRTGEGDWVALEAAHRA